LLITQAEREAIGHGKELAQACLAWTRDGRAIVIRDTKEFIDKLVPLASLSPTTKFSSVIRRLYRWGFRKVSSEKSDRRHYRQANVKERVFCHPLFQRDNKPLIKGMKSTTAESTRRAIPAHQLIEQQQTQLVGHMLDGSPSFSSATGALAPTPSSSFLQQVMASTRQLLSPPIASIGMLPSSLSLILPLSHHLLQDDLHRSSLLLNNIQQRLMVPDVTTMTRQAPLQTSVGYLLSSSGQQNFLARRAEVASRISLGYPDRLAPSRNERNQAAANEVLLGSQSTMSFTSLLRCNLQNPELFS
jgi:hypothetical protein